MSISSEITRITNAVANAYNEADAKGAEMPSALTVANLAQTIASISGGGGGLKVASGITTFSAQQSRFEIPHNLGVIPRFCIVFAVVGSNYTKVAGFATTYEKPPTIGDRGGFAVRNTAYTSKSVTDIAGYKTNANYHYVDNATISLAPYSSSYLYNANYSYGWVVVE